VLAVASICVLRFCSYICCYYYVYCDRQV